MVTAFPNRTFVLAVTIGAGLVAWPGTAIGADPGPLAPEDFVQYWSAGQLNARGENPYDPELLLAVQRGPRPDNPTPVMMWNPPWVLTLVMPVGLLPASPALIVWLAVSFGLLILASNRVWTAYGGSPDYRWIAWLVALSFAPSVFVLGSRQIGAFMMVGVAGFLAAQRSGRLFTAGAFAALMAIKPQLVYLFWVALAGWVVARPASARGRVIAGGLAAGGLASLIALSTNPDVFSQYAHALWNRPPDHWKTPTIGTFLRAWTTQAEFSLQFVPTAIGLAWLAGWAWWNRNRPWDWSDRLPPIVFMSFVTASYGAWPFDAVILLPFVIQAAAGIARYGDRRQAVGAAVIFTAFNVTAMVWNGTPTSSEYFIWLAPTLFAMYLGLRVPPPREARLA